MSDGASPNGTPTRQQIISSLSKFGRTATADVDLSDAEQAERDEMRQARRKRTASMAREGGAAEVNFATHRPQDPMFYWRQNNIPYNVWKEQEGQYDETQPHQFPELAKARQYSRILYATHPVIGSAIDIFTKWPLQGMEMQVKDTEIKSFYEDLFFDGLDYESFLIDVGRDYWTEGEAMPFAQFNELLGIWESDEVLTPDDVWVMPNLFSSEPRYEMRLPEEIRRIIRDRSPIKEYERLVANYPEMAKMGEYDRLDVSPVLLKQLKFNLVTRHVRGVPILLRAFRAVFQEEMLNAAQDAVASRLYTPLILTKLGATASDLGTQQPWIPDPSDIAAFEEAVDIALAGDFRMITHHFAVSMQPVFGRETMPRLDGDFDRLTERILQTFGLSKTMLSGASGGGGRQTYAADALNRDLISQLLSTYQKVIQKFVRDRMLVVAEAQEHYDYEMKGGKRIPIMEEHLEVQPDGSQRVVERPKLLVPDLNIQSTSMKDDATFRQFIEALVAAGVPISDQTRLVNVPIDLDDERDRTIDEQVSKAVAAQEARRQTYMALKADNLPIPQDLIDDFEPHAQDETGDSATPATREPDTEEALPNVAVDQPADDVTLVPTEDEMALSGQPGEPPSGEDKKVLTLPRNKTRPEESDEQRASMPRASALQTKSPEHRRQHDEDDD